MAIEMADYKSCEDENEVATTYDENISWNTGYNNLDATG